MNFHPKRRPRPVLQIISMIDILIVLLIFLVVSTTFKDKANHLNLTLPRSDAVASGADATPRLGLIVTKDDEIFLGDKPLAADALVAALQEAKTSRPDVKLELRIDEKVPFGTMVKVWDALKLAGFKMNEVPARVNRP
jgi:biopolymer transport protein ExbD